MNSLRRFVMLLLIPCLLAEHVFPVPMSQAPIAVASRLDSSALLSVEALTLASPSFGKMLRVQALLGHLFLTLGLFIASPGGISLKTMHTTKDAHWVPYGNILKDPNKWEIRVVMDGDFHHTEGDSKESLFNNLFYAAIQQLNERTAGTESGDRWQRLLKRNEGELLLQVSDELPVHAARAIRSDGMPIFVFNKRFVETLLTHWKKNGGVVPWLLAERLYHEFGHSKHAMTMPLELVEEVDQVYWDARLQMEVVIPNRLRILIPRFFAKKQIHGFGAKDYMAPGGLLPNTILRIQKGESERAVKDWLEQVLRPSYERSFFPGDMLRKLMQRSETVLKYFPSKTGLHQEVERIRQVALSYLSDYHPHEWVPFNDIVKWVSLTASRGNVRTNTARALQILQRESRVAYAIDLIRGRIAEYHELPPAEGREHQSTFRQLMTLRFGNVPHVSLFGLQGMDRIRHELRMTLKDAVEFDWVLHDLYVLEGNRTLDAFAKRIEILARVHAEKNHQKILTSYSNIEAVSMNNLYHLVQACSGIQRTPDQLDDLRFKKQVEEAAIHLSGVFGVQAEDLTAGFFVMNGGLIPGVAQRLGKYFRGEKSRLYRLFAGPFAEEFFGERVHRGRGVWRILSYIPLGFATLPILFMGLVNWAGVPVIVTLALGIYVSALLRWRFVVAHPKGARTVPVVIGILNAVLPPLVAYAFHFSVLGLIAAFMTAWIVHGVVNAAVRHVQRWGHAALEKWHWRDIHSEDSRRSAIDWTTHENVKVYRMGWVPEFLLPERPVWHMDLEKKLWMETLSFGFVFEFLFQLHGTTFIHFVLTLLFHVWHALRVRRKAHLKREPKSEEVVRAIRRWLYRWAEHILRRFMVKRGHEKHMEEIIKQALLDIEETHSIAEKRRLFRGYFRRSGYLKADHVMRDFDLYKKSAPSDENRIGDKEDCIQKLEGYFVGMMEWKGGEISDNKDRDILYFIESRLEDRDPWVVKAAIRALGAVSKHLAETDKLRILERYKTFLTTSDSPMIRGSVARAFSEEISMPQNLDFVVEQLSSGHQEPSVEGYLAGSLERLLRDNPLYPNSNQSRIRDLSRLLLKKVRNADAHLPVRVGSMKALGQLRGVDARVIQRVEKILMEDPEPTLQEAALWTMARLANAGSSHDMDVFLRALVRFIGGPHHTRRNVYLEQEAYDLLHHLEGLTADESLKANIHRLKRPEPELAENPMIILNLGSYGEQDETLLYALRRQLDRYDMSTVRTDGFRDDRDNAHFTNPEHRHHPDMSLRPELMRPVMDNLKKNLPARVRLWDWLRHKHALRMERLIVPIAGKPLVVFARPGDMSAVQDVCGKSTPVINLDDYRARSHVSANLLARALLAVPSAASVSHEETNKQLQRAG